MNEAFGMDLGPIVGDGDTPLEVLGVVKLLDNIGKVRHIPFRTENLSAVESHGMAYMLQMLAEEEVEYAMFTNMDVVEGDEE